MDHATFFMVFKEARCGSREVKVSKMEHFVKTVNSF